MLKSQGSPPVRNFRQEAKSELRSAKFALVIGWAAIVIAPVFLMGDNFTATQVVAMVAINFIFIGFVCVAFWVAVTSTRADKLEREAFPNSGG